jgi:RNA polymerase sigma-70 factor (ECF subfamily)
MVEHQRTPDVEGELASKEMLRLVLDRLQTSLSIKGLEMFHRLVLADEPVAGVCRDTGLSEEAVYAWRSRLARLARDIAREILGEQIAPPNVLPSGTSGEQAR